MKVLILASMLILLIIGSIYAIIEPGDPDYGKIVKEKMEKFEKEAMAKANTTLEIQEAFGKIEQEWDKELNIVYKKLMTKLTAEERTLLTNSQKSWLKYRDAEFEFMRKFYTQEKFGTLSVVDLGSYRTDLIKNRVLDLNRYLSETK